VSSAPVQFILNAAFRLRSEPRRLLIPSSNLNLAS
jgi:hypothetical protein